LLALKEEEKKKRDHRIFYLVNHSTVLANRELPVICDNSNAIWVSFRVFGEE
jgi:hypothetical protein